MTPDILVYTFAALFGAIVGSFLNVVILRLPTEGQSVIFPASHCPKCQTALRWYDNIPVVSYLCLRGRCRSCHASISLQYPIIELASAAVALLSFHKFGVTPAAFFYYLLAASLLVIIVIDLYHQIIPDVISLPGIVIGLAYSFFNPLTNWQSSVIGILAGGGVLYAIAVGYFYLRKIDGMGGGDIKLLAMIGAWLGWQSLPFVILFSSATGSVAGLIAMFFQKKGGHTRIPFGPFLSAAALLYTYYHEEIQYFYHLYLTGQWP